MVMFDGVEINDTDGSLARDNAEQEVDHRHHDGREQLEESLHPQMDDPETPRIHDGVICSTAEEHGRQIKDGDAEGRHHEERRHLITVGILAC